MKVTLTQKSKDAHFICKTSTGQTTEIHAPIIDGAQKEAPSPMETLLMAAAGCTAVDVLLILEKMKQPLEHLSIEVDGERKEMKSAKPFKGINFVYHIKGAVDQKKAERAVKLAVDKYCSVLESLRADMVVNWTVEIIK